MPSRPSRFRAIEHPAHQPTSHNGSRVPRCGRLRRRSRDACCGTTSSRAVSPSCPSVVHRHSMARRPQPRRIPTQASAFASYGVGVVKCAGVVGPEPWRALRAGLWSGVSGRRGAGRRDPVSLICETAGVLGPGSSQRPLSEIERPGGRAQRRKRGRSWVRECPDRRAAQPPTSSRCSLVRSSGCALSNIVLFGRTGAAARVRGKCSRRGRVPDPGELGPPTHCR